MGRAGCLIPARAWCFGIFPPSKFLLPHPAAFGLSIYDFLISLLPLIPFPLSPIQPAVAKNNLLTVAIKHGGLDLVRWRRVFDQRGIGIRDGDFVDQFFDLFDDTGKDWVNFQVRSLFLPSLKCGCHGMRLGCSVAQCHRRW